MKKKNEHSDSNLIKFGFFLHRNLGIHILLTLILNIIISFTVVGIYDLFNYSVFSFSLVGLIVFNVVATLIETMVLILVLRHFLQIVLKSFGTIIILIHSLIFYITTLIIEDVSFNKNVILNIFIYTVSFLLLRIITKIVIRRLQLRKEGNNNDI